MSDNPAEPVLEALLNTLQSVAAFRTTGRRARHWSQVSEQPALFLRHIGDTDQYSGEMSITTLECEVWIYSQAGEDDDATPDSALTVLVRKIRQAFPPEDETRFTLGGLVYWCRIEGRSDYSPGDQGGQAIARIPVRVTLL